MGEPFRQIAIPASTSNLGPGFDTLSVAVDLYLRLRVMDIPADGAGAVRLSVAGVAPAGENRIETAYELACSRFGRPAMSIEAGVACDIPPGAGLGSSAAAAVAGFRLYEAARGVPLDEADLLAMASLLEGHPDNAAAALLGGMTLSCQTHDGRVIARSWAWPAEIRLVIGTPGVELLTNKARAVLPESIPLRDAVANLQRALLLVRALETGRYEDIREALHDSWHQPVRAPLVPGLEDALAIDHPSVLGVCLSGAGPSILALAAPGRSEEAAAVLGEVYRRRGAPHTIRNLAAHPSATARQPVAAAERERTA
jgi:homoserine kinase